MSENILEENHIDLLALLPGKAYGLMTPIAMLTVTVPNFSTKDITVLNKIIAAHVPVISSTKIILTGDVLNDYINSILYWATMVQMMAGVPVFEVGKSLPLSTSSSNKIVFALPYAQHRAQAAIFSFEWAEYLFRKFYLDEQWDEQFFSSMPKLVHDLMDKLNPYILNSKNHFNFLFAAYQKNIPCAIVAGTCYQFGWGVASQWLDSSFTQMTSLLGTNFAKDKIIGAQVLRRAGLPVPDHALVYSLEDALLVAQQLTYPVVVKPNNLDGGLGVAAGLLNAQALTAAYLEARKYSPHILIEKHFVGEDYRLTVLHGKLVWIIHRRPGGVMGDGQHTVRELLDITNKDPRRGTEKIALLTKIVIDDEADALLAEQGLAWDSVVTKDQFIRLRRTANINTGGYPTACLDRVHIDNQRLVERAARVLKLDIAGVDLLIPDIAVSWRESGAVICEVNAQPSLSPATQRHLYDDILASLVFGTGRIPVMVIVGQALADSIAYAVAAMLTAQGLCVGVVATDALWVGSEKTLSGKQNIFTASQLLMSDKEVEAIIVVVNDNKILKTGLAFDRYDVLVVAESLAGYSYDSMLFLMAFFAENTLNKIVINAADPIVNILQNKMCDARMIKIYLQNLTMNHHDTGVWLEENQTSISVIYGNATQVTTLVQLPKMLGGVAQEHIKTILFSVAAAIILGIDQTVFLDCLQNLWRAPNYFGSIIGHNESSQLRMADIYAIDKNACGDANKICHVTTDVMLRRTILSQARRQGWDKNISVRRQLKQLTEDILVDDYLRHEKIG